MDSSFGADCKDKNCYGFAELSLSSFVLFGMRNLLRFDLADIFTLLQVEKIGHTAASATIGWVCGMFCTRSSNQVLIWKLGLARFWCRFSFIGPTVPPGHPFINFETCAFFL